MVHRGAVLGVLLGQAGGCTVNAFFDPLVISRAIDAKISALPNMLTEPPLTNES